jgi:hypothetical protein
MYVLDSLWVAGLATAGAAAGDIMLSVGTVYWLQSPAVSGFGVSFTSMLLSAPFCFLAWAALHVLELMSTTSRTAQSTTAAMVRSMFSSLRICVMFTVSCYLLAVSSMLNNYASPASRTAPIVQAVLPAVAPVFFIPFSKAILHDKKVYLALRPLVSLGLILSSTVLALLPMLPGVSPAGSSANFDNGEGDIQLAWATIYAASFLPQALATVMLQVVLLQLAAHPDIIGCFESANVESGLDSPLLSQGSHSSRSADNDRLGESVNSATPLSIRSTFAATSSRRAVLAPIVFAAAIVTLQQVTLAVCIGLCMWMDFVPWLGVSSSAESFAQSSSATLRCSLWGKQSGVEDCSNAVPQYTWLVAAGIALNAIMSIFLTWQSAVFSQVASLAGDALQAIVWLTPGLAPAGSVKMPLWSSLPALLLSISGIALWKTWEQSCGLTSAMLSTRGASAESQTEKPVLEHPVAAAEIWESASGEDQTV